MTASNYIHLLQEFAARVTAWYMSEAGANTLTVIQEKKKIHALVSSNLHSLKSFTVDILLAPEIRVQAKKLDQYLYHVLVVQSTVSPCSTMCTIVLFVQFITEMYFFLMFFAYCATDSWTDNKLSISQVMNDDTIRQYFTSQSILIKCETFPLAAESTCSKKGK